MARRKPSLRSVYDRARRHVADLEAQYSKLERSRPRTPGKKGTKTKRLNKLKALLRVARGRRTKARKAVARVGQERAPSVKGTRLKRSEAAKKGWQTRRARLAPRASGDFWRHLLPDGSTITVGLGESDSSLEGKYWNAYAVAMAGQGDLRSFDGLSVFDLDRQRRFPFGTDLDVLAEHVDEIDFGPGFYKRRNQSPGDSG